MHKKQDTGHDMKGVIDTILNDLSRELLGQAGETFHFDHLF